MQRKKQETQLAAGSWNFDICGHHFILFSTYQSWLNVKFEQQVMENYTAYIESEGAQFSSAVDDIQDTPQTLASLIMAGEQPLDTEALNPGLTRLSERNAHFEIQAPVSGHSMDEDQRQTLSRNETVVTRLKRIRLNPASFRI